MIVSRILDYLGGDKIDVAEPIIDGALAAMRHALHRNFGNVKDEERRGLHASSPMYCQRKILYGMRGEEREPIKGRGLITLAYGNTAEALIVMLARIVLKDEVLAPTDDGVQESGTLMVAGIPVTCHIDLLTKGPEGKRIPHEIKSMNARSFGEFKKAILDPAHKWHDDERWGYKCQLGVYVKKEEAPYGTLIGMCKDTGHLAEMVCPRDLLWETEYEHRVVSVMKNMESGALPPRPAFATTEILPGANQRPDGSKGPVEQVKHWRCKYCAFNQKCWDGFAVVPLAAGPEWRKAV